VIRIIRNERGGVHAEHFCYVVLVTSNMTFASHSDKSMSFASAKRDRSEEEPGIAMDRKTDSILTGYHVPPTP
jgi:hypothetical protein